METMKKDGDGSYPSLWGRVEVDLISPPSLLPGNGRKFIRILIKKKKRILIQPWDTEKSNLKKKGNSETMITDFIINIFYNTKDTINKVKW